MLAKSKLSELYEANEDAVFNNDMRSIQISKGVMKYIVDNSDVELIVDITDELRFDDIMRELETSQGLNVISEFKVSSNIKCSDIEDKVVVSISSMTLIYLMIAKRMILWNLT